MKTRLRPDRPRKGNDIRLAEEQPDKTKCADLKSRELAGRTAGDRGACEKSSTAQGSE
jgi:hypothetical protein